jgi:hypothetical protein
VLKEFNNDAVLDKETGLVWEQSPGDTNGDGIVDIATDREPWQSAHRHCSDKVVGNRKGWRLPSVQELTSLVDPTQSSPALPSGHPFDNIQSHQYWTATSIDFNASSTSGALYVLLINGNVLGDSQASDKFVWCVRGGQGGIVQG